MQIKVTPRYDLTPIRMAKTKNTDDKIILERIWVRGTNFPPLLVVIQTSTAILETSMLVSQKTVHQSTSIHRSTPLGNIPKGGTIIPRGHLLNYIHSIIICSIQSLQTTRWPSTEEWIKYGTFTQCSITQLLKK